MQTDVATARQKAIAGLVAAGDDAGVKDRDPYWHHGLSRPQRWVQRAYHEASAILERQAPEAAETVDRYLTRMSDLVRELRGTGPDLDDESWYDSAIDEACSIIRRAADTTPL